MMKSRRVKQLHGSLLAASTVLALVLALTLSGLAQAAGISSEFEGAAIHKLAVDPLLDEAPFDPNDGSTLGSKTELRHLSAAKYSLLITVGDNDGYGYGYFVVPDGTPLPRTDPPYDWLFDNRSAEERADTYARHTDYQSFSQGDFTLRFSFDPAMFSKLDTAWINIDISGLQQGAWSDLGLGPTLLYLDGDEAEDFAKIANQGAWGSGVFTYGVSTALIADGILDARFDLQNIPVQPYFDCFSLDYATLVVSGDLVPPEVPVLVSPADGSTIDANFPAFQWRPSAGAVAYEVQIDDDLGFGSPNVWLGWYQATVYDSSLFPNGTYYWRVRSIAPTEEVSGWSDTAKFEIIGPYQVPSEFQTIQAAINAIPVFSGGEVLVAPGIYTGIGNRNLSGFADKSVQVRSSGGPEVTIIDCQGLGDGFYFSSYTGAGTIIDGFTISNASGGDGGGGAFECYSAWITVNNCIVENSLYEAMVVRSGAQPTVTNSTFRNNGGPGIYVYSGGNVVIDSCTFDSNRGQGLRLNGVGESTVISNSTFENNFGAEGEGTGVDAYNYSTVRFVSCVFRNNEASGVSGWNADFSFDDCLFTQNGQYNSGGGLYVSSSSGSQTTITDCTFDGNTGYNGGGVFAYNASLDITGSLFDGNTAQHRGGAVYVNWSSTASAVGCTFVNNAADSGSAFYIESDPNISKDGSGPTKSLGGAGVYECLIAFATQGEAIFLEQYAWIEIGCTDIYGNAGGDWTGAISTSLGQAGNFSANPIFCDPTNGDYNVTANSPVANANTTCGTIGAFDVGCAAIEIGISPVALSFAGAVDDPGNPPAQNLQINNLGGSNLNWTLSEQSSWLQVNVSSGSAPATVSVSVNKSGLTGGVYNGELVVVCDDAINSPRIIPVTLTLTAGEIAVSPALLDFAMTYGDLSPPDPQILTVSNSGSGALSCQLSHGSTWLQLSESQFSVDDAPHDVTINIDPTDLPHGAYEDTIVIMSGDAINSPMYVGVTLTITDVAPPTLWIGSSTHSIDSSGETMMIAVNVGDNLSIEFVATTTLPGVVPVLGISDPPPGSLFQPISDGVSRFDWIPVPQLSGVQYITIIADDDYQTTSLTVGIAINSIPQFSTDFSDKDIIESEQLIFVVTATDNDPVQPTISWNNVPPTAIFDNATPGTATLTFTPDHTDVDAVYEAEFTASDGIASATGTLTIRVANRQLTVLTMQPSPGTADDILITDSIEIQFNEAIDPSSLSSSLVLTSSKGTALGYRYVSGENQLLVGAATGMLESHDNIDVTLNPGLLDLAGHTLDQQYITTFVTGTAVYPGDANNDGVVDGRDILPLGLYYGNSGPVRGAVPDLTWQMVPGHVSFDGESWSPTGGAYADADGSGVIDAEDICGITDNWTSTHTVSGDDKTSSGDLATSLASQDQNVLMALYAAVIECSDGAGKSYLSETLRALLNSPPAEAALPTNVELYQNYPNPFNPYTSIRFYLPTSGQATLSVYNMLGQRVATLIDGSVNAGYVEADWDGTGLDGGAVASGIYFYRLETSDFNETKRMLLLK